jgi:hypothetical protein
MPALISWGPARKWKDYYDDVEMPGSQLKIGFHGDRGVSEQIFIIPFRERGRLVCRVEPGYAIIVNDAR